MPEARHEAAERGLLARRAGPVEGVRRQRLPALTQLLAQPVQIDEALPEETVAGVLGRLLHEAVQGEPEAWRRLERSRPNASTSTSPDSRSRWAIAKRAAMAPPSPCPTSAGGDGQVCSISSPSHPSTWSGSSGPSATSEAPWPGRSGATTRWVVTRSGITRIHRPANSPELCSRTTGGPSPPSSTAVETPANCSRRSVTGIAVEQPLPSVVAGGTPVVLLHLGLSAHRCWLVGVGIWSWLAPRLSRWCAPLGRHWSWRGSQASREPPNFRHEGGVGNSGGVGSSRHKGVR